MGGVLGWLAQAMTRAKMTRFQGKAAINLIVSKQKHF
jgi:hypothetical protein